MSLDYASRSMETIILRSIREIIILSNFGRSFIVAFYLTVHSFCSESEGNIFSN